MDKILWRRIRTLFDTVSELPPNQRRAYLDRTCGDDPQLFREVESLLAASEAGPPWRHNPASELGRRLREHWRRVSERADTGEPRPAPDTETEPESGTTDNTDDPV
ncbi:MAG: hypothetical protein ABIF77_18150 [bacterium]